MENAILLINLGTPNSANPADVKKYLTEFLLDPLVIDIPWIIRQFLVRGIIIPRRYKESAQMYKKIWTDKGSPLLIYGKKIQTLLQNELENSDVYLAMRYQNPSIEKIVNEIKKKPYKNILTVPLFPQYAKATTQSVINKVNRCFGKKVPSILQFADEEKMIQAFCEKIKQSHYQNYDAILFSFHGLPERQIRKSDKEGKCLSNTCCEPFTEANRLCYKAQCYRTMRAIANKLQLPGNQYHICFQSRLGKEPWIQPYTSDVIERLAKRGVKKLLVCCPAFVCDCLETLVEIQYEYRKLFEDLGGERLDLVEGLNDHPLWIQSLKELVTANLPKNQHALL